MSDTATAGVEPAPTPDAGTADAPDLTPAAAAPPGGGSDGDTGGAPPAEGVATADSHGSQQAADAANADAALQGDDVALDALPSKWQAEVRRLRDENAESRVTAKRYSEPLAALEPHEQEWVLGLAQDLGNAETQVEAARRMRAVADSLLEGQPEPEEEQKPLTYADYERIKAEEQSRAQSEAQVQAVFDEAKELGYEKDTPDFAMLMWLAANAEKPEDAGDLKAAHKRIEDGRRHIIDQFVAEQKAKGAQFPAQAAGGAPAQQATPPKTFKEARERAEARAAAAKAALSAAGR